MLKSEWKNLEMVLNVYVLKLFVKGLFVLL